jgi:outer membrane autotransporter protein
MYTWFGGDATSDRGVGADMGGGAFAASLEGGYPFALGGGARIEPQAQLIWQNIDLGSTSGPYTSIDYDSLGVLTGRLGVRLEGNATVDGMPLQSFFGINLWHDFSTSDTVSFNGRPVTTDIGGTALEFQGGLSAQLTDSIGVYGSLGLITGVANGNRHGVNGNLGVRVRW